MVDDLMWLVREHLGEQAELFERDSAGIGDVKAATGLLRGGLDAREVGAAVRRSGARVVHAHNLLPVFGWRALAAARGAGARTVLHLHNYRVVCAVGTCVDPSGNDCTRCHGRDTRPGVRLNCRGARPEGLAYASALSLWQRRMLSYADVVVVPSDAALQRLRALGAPLPGDVRVVGHFVRELASAPVKDGGYALVASRLAREKDIATAIEACRIAGVELVVAGDGPLAGELRSQAGSSVRFAGRVAQDELSRLRAGARVALVPSVANETFGLAALEAMAAGLPVIASRVGALTGLSPGARLVEPADPRAMASAIEDVLADPQAGERALAFAREQAAPERAAVQLRTIYDASAGLG